MKKFLKFLVATSAIVGGIAGVVYFLDRKKEEDIFDDDDEAFEDVFDDEEEDRDYVTLEFEKEEKPEEEKPEEQQETDGQ